MEAKSGSPAGLLQGLFEFSRNLQKRSLASSRKATASMLYDQQCCLLMLMICVLQRVAVCSIVLHCNVDVSRQTPSVNAHSHCTSLAQQLLIINSGRTVMSTCSQGDSLVTALLVGSEMGLLHMQVHLGPGAVGALCSAGHSGVWPKAARGDRQLL